MSDAPRSPERTVKDIVLKEVDREIIQVAARLFMALEPGETREAQTGSRPDGAIAHNGGRSTEPHMRLASSPQSFNEGSPARLAIVEFFIAGGIAIWMPPAPSLPWMRWVSYP